MQDIPGAGVFRNMSLKPLVGLGKVETGLPVLPFPVLKRVGTD